MKEEINDESIIWQIIDEPTIWPGGNEPMYLTIKGEIYQLTLKLEGGEYWNTDDINNKKYMNLLDDLIFD